MDKQLLSDTMIYAIEKLDLSGKQVADILHLENTTAVSWIKNKNYWKMVSTPIWQKLEDWFLSRDDLKEFYQKEKPLPPPEEHKEEKHPRIEKVILTEKYPIEKGIPIPPKEIAGPYPFSDMEVGDSFKVPIVLNTPAHRVYSRCSTAIKRFRKDHPEWKFALRTLKVEGYVRCWRTE